MICKFMSKKQIGLTLDAMISMQNKPNSSLCHPDCQKPATNFLLHLVYSQFVILKYVYNINALTGQDDVWKQR